jgi:small subunit ribosomal protein S4
MIRKPYPPGKKGKRGQGALSEYGKELKEKQKLKNWYNLNERQFSNYVKEILRKGGKVEDTVSLLIQKLELRFDNVIFRLGFATSRAQARQLISHGHFLINGKGVNIPSYQLKKGDKVTIRSGSLNKTIFKKLSLTLKKYQPPSWLSLKKENFEGEVVDKPNFAEATPPAEVPAIFEYYSR